MKEELVELRNLTNDFSEAKKEFETRKEQFNEEVKTTMVVLPEQALPANYELVGKFLEEYKLLDIHSEELKKEHPRYGEATRIKTLVKFFKETKEYQNRIWCADQIVKAYLTFEKAGYREVRELDEKTQKLGSDLANKVSDVKTEKVDSAIKTVNDVVDTIKPYGVVAKKQLTVLGGVAKTALANGAKKLVKILEEDNK